jgi:hypothetical protein
MSPSAPEESPTLLERRVGTLVEVAVRHRTRLPIDDLSALLPTEAPPTPQAMRDWLHEHPNFARWEEGLELDGADPEREGRESRRRRGERFLAEAHHLAETRLGPVSPLLCSLAVTGSTAYGYPEAGDDLDFLAIVRRGGLWTFLAYAYLAARWHRVPTPEGPTEWCFNFVVEDGVAQREFSVPRGFFIAREALVARPVLGAGYYRGLVANSEWLRSEVPRLFALWSSTPNAPAPEAAPAPVAVRVLNLALYPWMAAYLHLVSLVRARRLRRSEKEDRSFRVVARPDRLFYETARFEELRSAYHGADVLEPEPRGPDGH